MARPEEVFRDRAWLDELLAAVADPQVDVLERTAVRPIDVTQEEYQRQSRARMDESKVAAISVALDRVGYDVTVEGDGVEVVSVLEGTPAEGVLEAGDIITAINGKPVFVGTDAVAEISTYARVENWAYRMVRSMTRRPFSVLW